MFRSSVVLLILQDIVKNYFQLLKNVLFHTHFTKLNVVQNLQFQDSIQFWLFVFLCFFKKI